MSKLSEHWRNLGFGQKVKYIFYGTIGLVVLIFALLNWQKINLHLVFGELEIPVTILIFVSMFAGYAYAKLFSFQKSRKKDKEISYLKGELAATREKLKRPMPSSSNDEDNANP